MRHYIAIILLGGMLTQLFYSSGFLIDYYVNTDVYEQLCKNKDKPMLQCDGKCILAQKIAALEKENSDPATPPIPIISLRFLPSLFVLYFEISESVVLHQSTWQPPFIQSLIFSLFKPPI